MKKVIAAWVVVISLLGGVVYATNAHRQETVDTLVTKVDLSEQAKMQWEESRTQLLGAPITGLDIDSPVVRFNYPDQMGLILNIQNKHSDIRGALSCDARTGTYDYGYEHGTLEGSDVPTDFAIIVYKEGTDIIYENDLRRLPIFSSSRGDTNLKEALDSIKKLPDGDLVSFVVEHTGSDYLTSTVGWGPTFTVKEFKQVLKKVNFAPCEEVELVSPPTVL
ncbi:hypothetical protein CF8_0242 [Aeromonas phage CF8]|nr:hypothetical protein CF8_0242 [Aeromonas phage CF8]